MHWYFLAAFLFVIGLVVILFTLNYREHPKKLTDAIELRLVTQ